MQGRNFLKEHEEFAAELSSYGTHYGYPDTAPKDLNLPDDFAKEVDPDVIKYARVPIPYDYKTHYFFLLQYDALKKNAIAPANHEEAFQKYDVSIGSYTLEWLLPTPPPFHTYDELPIIKETPSYKEDD